MPKKTGEIFEKKRTVDEQEASTSSEITLEDECRELTKHSTSLYSTINILMRKLFSDGEILNSSVSGKAANSTTAAKPRFNQQKLDLISKICLNLHGETSGITEKIQAVKKLVKREHESKKIKITII